MSRTSLVKRLPIARDVAAAELRRYDAARKACRDHFELRGYTAIETPLLEQTELFLRKSGGELASRLYSFTDPGGYAVSLRPEFTAAVIRHVIETGVSGPARLHYGGPVFRYPTPGTPAQREPGVFVQAGAELIGGAAPYGDAEVVAMAWSGLRGLGVESPVISIGHVGVLWELLRPYDLSDRAQLFLVQSVGRLRAGGDAVESIKKDATEIGLFRANGNGPQRLDGDGASVEVVESLLSRTLGGPIGQVSGARTAEEIMARLARKLQALDDEKALTSALEFVSAVAAVRGPAGEALEQGRRVARDAGQPEAAFRALEEVVAAVVDNGVPESAITVDLGLARDIAYYTGSVFDLGTADGAVSLGGGGRYDGLMNSLGAGRDVPAIGFAYNLDAVLSITKVETEAAKATVLVAPATKAAVRAAAAYAESLRSKGNAAISAAPATDSELERIARAAGASKIVKVSEAGAATTVSG